MIGMNTVKIHWENNDRILLSILAGLNSAVVGIFSTCSLFPNLQVPVPFIWWPYRACQLQVVSISPTCSIVFFQFSCKVRIIISFRFHSVLSSDQPERQNLLLSRFSFLLIISRSCRLSEIKWSIWILKSQRILCVSFLGWIPGCAYTICSYGHI